MATSTFLLSLRRPFTNDCPAQLMIIDSTFKFNHPKTPSLPPSSQSLAAPPFIHQNVFVDYPHFLYKSIPSNIHITMYSKAGKRKPRADKNKAPPPPAFVNYTSRMDSLLKEKSSHPVGTSGVKPLASLMDIMESSVKRSSSHHSVAHRHHNLSRALLLRLPRHYHNRHYPNQYSTHHGGASTSHGKDNSTSDDTLALKLACKSESKRHTERKEKASRRPERIRSISLVADMASPDVDNMECGLCQKLLRRRPIIILETTISSNDLSIVAVLTCGHVYHAECLEMKTCYEDRTDPPCPLCV